MYINIYICIPIIKKLDLICMHVHRLLPGTATAAEGAVDAGDWGASPDGWPTAAWSLFIFAILASNYKWGIFTNVLHSCLNLIYLKGLNLIIQRLGGTRGVHPQKTKPSF